MIWSHEQTRKPELGQASPSHPDAGHRVRDGGRPSRTEEAELRCLHATKALVLSQPESGVRSPVATRRVGNAG